MPTNALAGTTFTPTVITVDGVALKVSSKTSGGTLTVTLHDSTLNSDVTSTTLDVADLPSNGWFFVKWSGSQILLIASAYQIQIKTSSAGTVTLFRDATAGNWCRMNRTTATAQAPAVNDKLLVLGEMTGISAAGNSFTLTMQNTATTSFGPVVSGGPPQGIHVGKRGTWTNGTGAANYYFKWKGIFAVWDQGTLNIGTSGTPVPSGSTAVYEMDSVANVDTGFDFKAGSTVNIYGTKGFTASPSNHYSLLTLSRGGYCTTNGTAVTAVTSQAQSFTGLTGAIVINAVSYTISSVTNATNLVLTGTAGVQASPVAWTHAGTANVLTVGDTTGWAVSDLVYIGSTSRTRLDSELATILTVDSATQVTLSASATKQHLGTSPTQGEVGNITRNVKIRGISTVLQGYVFISGITAQVTVRYAEFYNLGSATVSKRGIDHPTGVTTTLVSDFQYCSFHDFTVTSSLVGLVLSTGAGAITFSHNVFANNSTHIAHSGYCGLSTISDNLFILSTGANTFSTDNITFSNNRIVSCAGIGLAISGAGGTATFSGNNIHSGTVSGVTITSLASGSVDSNTSWRNSTFGVTLVSPVGAFTLSNFTAFGNVTSMTSSVAIGVKITNFTANGDTVFSTGSGITLAGPTWMLLQSCSFSQVSGILTAHTTDFTMNPINSLTAAAQWFQVACENCLFGAATWATSPSSMETAYSFIGSQRHNSAGTHRCQTAGGLITIDTAIFRTASPSARITPSSASVKAVTAPVGWGFTKQVTNGATCTASVYVRKSRSTDAGGANYLGAQPRLILRKNIPLGIDADVVLATMSTANPPTGSDVWELLSGTSVATVTDDGVAEYYVDADLSGAGTGWINVDDFQ